MKRGRPAFDPRVAVCLWVLIEAHREPIRADRPRTSIRQACERLRTELKDLCEVGISMERLRTVHRTITNRLETDSDMRRYAIEKLASITVWRRKLIADGLGAYRRQIIPLLYIETS